MSDIVKQMRPVRVRLDTGYTYSIDKKLSEYLEDLNEYAAQCPEEYKDSIEIEIRAISSYDSAELEFSMSYFRPETVQEEKIRMEKEQHNEDDRKRYELRQLAELQKKYGVTK